MAAARPVKREPFSEMGNAFSAELIAKDVIVLITAKNALRLPCL